MLKKTEESEWSRFSRVLSKEPRTTEETPVQEELEAVPAPAEALPAAAPIPPVSRPAVAQSYVRPQQIAAVPESDEIETVIGVHSFFDGTFRCDSSMRIKGTVQGEIICSKSLTIEESAKVNAKVSAANATIAGSLEGSVVCDGRLEVVATGRVTGELTAGVLIIQEGAFFEGHLKMKERKSDGAAAPEVAE